MHSLVVHLICVISVLLLSHCYPLTVDRASRFIRKPDNYVGHLRNSKCSVIDPITNTNSLITEYRRKRFVTDNSKWPTTNIYWKVVKYSKHLTDEEVNETFDAAFKLWESSTSLKFIRVSDQEKSHIRISFWRKSHGDAFSFDGSGGELAHAFYPNKGGEIHIDDDEPWAPPSSFGRDLFPVAAHEIGHALGLRHSSIKEALMYPEYKGKNEVVALDQDDIDGIKFIYAPSLTDVSVQKKNKMQHSGVPLKPIKKESEFTTETTTAVDQTTESYEWSSHGLSTGETSGTTTAAAETTTMLKIEPTPRHAVYHSFTFNEDICNDPKFDVVVVLQNGTAYLFKGTLYWRLNGKGYESGYPRNIENDWGIPGHLDAAYTDSNGDTYFFKGEKYWLFADGQFAEGYPKSIANDFVQTPNNLDAVVQLDGKLYFFKGKRYWPYIEDNSVQDWPRDIKEISPNLTGKIDAGGTFIDGNSYLFSGHQYFKIEQIRNEVKIASGYPKPTGPRFFGCKS